MEFHPSKLPISKTFDVKDEKAASEAAEEMVNLGFTNRKEGFKVTMPKEKKLAQRIGFIVTTGVNVGLRKTKQDRNVRFWTYHQDEEHYAIVLIGAQAFEELGF